VLPGYAASDVEDEEVSLEASSPPLQLIREFDPQFCTFRAGRCTLVLPLHN
jgi:hypothetical protein